MAASLPLIPTLCDLLSLYGRELLLRVFIFLEVKWTTFLKAGAAQAATDKKRD
jgi:hypothetical protein